jgi:Protein kinase domain
VLSHGGMNDESRVNAHHASSTDGSSSSSGTSCSSGSESESGHGGEDVYRTKASSTTRRLPHRPPLSFFPVVRQRRGGINVRSSDEEKINSGSGDGPRGRSFRRQRGYHKSKSNDNTDCQYDVSTDGDDHHEEKAPSSSLFWRNLLRIKRKSWISLNRTLQSVLIDTRCGTISTFVLCASICLWLLIFLYTTMIHTSRIPTEALSMMNNDANANLHLTIHERSQLRRQERKATARRRRGFRSSRNQQGWISRMFWGALGYRQAQPPDGTNPAVIARPRGNSETLPKECARPAWQDFNFVTCNDIHDIDLAAILSQTKTNALETGFVASGLWRSVWAVNPRAVVSDGPTSSTRGSSSGIVVLKTMRREHDVTPRNLDRHRRDALVMERLSASPYVVQAYAYCGNSVVTEFLDTTLDDLIFDDNLLLGSNETYISSTRRLHWALDVARGIQALHNYDGTDGGGAIVHADLQAKQFLVSPVTGTVKVNDFNRCRFMALNRTSSTTTSTARCSFRIPTAPGKMRAPEEYNYGSLNEKIDMYSVANILYSIFTKREAWFEFNERDAKFKIQDGVAPTMDIALRDMTPPIRTRLIELTQRAYALDPDNRISAKELVAELERVLESHAGSSLHPAKL